MGTLRIDVDGIDELQAVVDDLRKAKHGIQDDMVDAIREEAENVRAIAKLRVLDEPVHSRYHSGLREKISRGTLKEDTRDGAEVYNQPEGEDWRLPADMDQGAWSHPVYGHRNEWVRQGGYFSWFMDTMDLAEEPLEHKAEELLDKWAERIAAA